MNQRALTTESLTALPLRVDGGQALYGPIERIPAESHIQILGDSTLGGMVDIEWHGRRYAAFAVDAQQRCTAEMGDASPSSRRSQVLNS